MQLTRHTDYAFRLLIDLAGRQGSRTQVAEVAAAQAISRTHLMKIVNRLARAGIVDAVRGRGGGIALARAPHEINLADVVAITEPSCDLVDCAGCRLARRCKLPGVLDQASRAFEASLSRFTLDDILPDNVRRPAGGMADTPKLCAAR